MTRITDTIELNSKSGLGINMTTLYFWEVVCVGKIPYRKNFGKGIHRTYYRKETVSSKNKLFTKKADAIMYLYHLKNSGYSASYMHKFYSR